MLAEFTSASPGSDLGCGLKQSLKSGWIASWSVVECGAEHRCHSDSDQYREHAEDYS